MREKIDKKVTEQCQKKNLKDISKDWKVSESIKRKKTKKDESAQTDKYLDKTNENGRKEGIWE